ncbi:Phage Tail Collar Domain protein [Stieleria bergensis]|uniref:Phage Tail Collar Domain protein n=1 Tax=Stieleria bergensis TaxID=2528025 RepID=A0A517SVK5_9BACT|nr:Phage Tail Collar Domain protein [Planctomycetes bacterium SV_7m_r]
MKITLAGMLAVGVATVTAYSLFANQESTTQPPEETIESTPFLGEIRLVPYSFAPKGWADCNGQLLPIQQHTSLYSLLGITYGGDGRTTFALPDLRSRAAVHVGEGSELQSVRLGQPGDEIPVKSAQNSNKSTPAFLGLRFIIALDGQLPPPKGSPFDFSR